MRTPTLRLILIVFAVAGVGVASSFQGCSGDDDASTSGQSRLRLATTTSTIGSGLLGELIPVFEEQYAIEVEILARGTGAALQLARAGGADVVLVHAREAEDQFVMDGYGVNRRDVMYNDFVLLGPAEDPAGIRGMRDVLEGLRRVAEVRSDFLTRGDDSGTHLREMQLWRLAEVDLHEDWRVESGAGMLETLRGTSENGHYLLSDRSTYLSHSDELQLEIMVEGDQRLFNPYGVIAVNPASVPGVNFAAAMKFIDFVTSSHGQRIIGLIGTNRFDRSLFTPLAPGE